MPSIFGFFKRKPRADAPETPPDDAPAATTATQTTVTFGPSGERIIAPITPDTATAPQLAPDPIAVPSAAQTLAATPPAPASTDETDIATRPAPDSTAAPPAAETEIAAPPTPESIGLRPLADMAPPTLHPASAAAVAMLSRVDVPGDPVGGSDRATAERPSSSWFSRLKSGLDKTRQQLGGRLVGVFGAGRKLDEAFYEELETVLLSSDVGVSATEFLLDNLRARARREGYTEADQLREALGDLLLELLSPLARPLEVSTHRPFVIMLAGVNGSGKTTSIGKLTRYYQQQGKKILLAAGDTFRAAAREQLIVWGERNNVTVVTQQSGDAAAVIFDAVNAASARGIDVVLADTAGRLPTQLHLMDEIKKVKRVVAKALPGAPHEVLLVLDANTGQNALAQVKAFDDALGVTGLIMTKLDGTAKGGVIAAIAHTRSKANAGQPIPLRFIGVGEGIDDLRPFDAEDFVAALLGDDDAPM